MCGPPRRESPAIRRRSSRSCRAPLRDTSLNSSCRIRFAARQASDRLTVLPGDAAELLGGEEGLRQKPLEAARPADDVAIFLRQLLEAEHGDDVFELRVLRQRAAHFLREVGSAARPTIPGVSHLGVRLQRIDGREEAFARSLAREGDGSRTGARKYARPPDR
jgi:hypothetical protein